MALDAGETADQRAPVERLELVEERRVDEPGDHLAHVVADARVGRDDAVQFLFGIGRAFGRRFVARAHRRRREVGDDRAYQRERVLVVGSKVIGDAGDTRVHVGAAEFFRGDDLAGRGLHERRAAQEDRAVARDDHRLVRHRRHVRTAGRARAHDRGDLRDALARHARLIVEDASEVIAVGEDVRLHRQERAAGVDEIDARQVVLLRDLLRAQMLANGQRVVGAALDGRVVRDDHAVAALDRCDPGHDTGRRRRVAVDAVGGQRAQLEERRRGIGQPVDPLAGRQLAAFAVAGDRFGAAAQLNPREPFPQVGHHAANSGGVGGKIGGRRVDTRFQQVHGYVLDGG